MKFYQLALKAFKKIHLNIKCQYLFISIFTNNKLPSLEASKSYLNKKDPDIGGNSYEKNNLFTPKVDVQVVVPAYNCENTIEQCVKSILDQKTNYKVQLVAVDDGSIDKTGEILDKLNKVYSNLVVVHQKNGGLSEARNTGLRHIYGKYVLFVDADDTLTSHSIDRLLDNAFENNADIVEGGYNLISKGKIVRSYRHKFQKNVNPFETLYGYPWGKLYKSSLFANVIFPQKYWFEDTMAMYRIWPNANNVVTIDVITYNYLNNEQGIAHSSQGNLKIIDTLWITLKLVEDYQKSKLNCEQDVYNFTLQQIKMNARRISSLNDEMANKANFVISIALINKFFLRNKTNKEGLKYIEKAIKYKNYKQFMVLVFGQ